MLRALTDSMWLSQCLRYLANDSLDLLGRGHLGRETMLGQALEAFVGALYLDQNFSAAVSFVQEHFLCR